MAAIKVKQDNGGRTSCPSSPGRQREPLEASIKIKRQSTPKRNSSNSQNQQSKIVIKFNSSMKELSNNIKFDFGQDQQDGQSKTLMEEYQ